VKTVMQILVVAVAVVEQFLRQQTDLVALAALA